MSFRVTVADFLTSADFPEDFPRPEGPEIAFAGRSNVGKSSAINTLTNRKRLAITSSTPGRTRLVNFFDIAGHGAGGTRERRLRFVDLPGYGFAAAAKNEKDEWRARVEGYLVGREPLRAVVHLLDLRHDASGLDLDLSEWLRSLGQNEIPVFTKADKLNRNEQKHQQLKLEKMLGVPAGAGVLFSSLDGIGRDELWKRILGHCS